MDRRRIYQVDVFTRERFLGNPAGVVANAAGLGAQAMQALARELNNSETAFLLPATDDAVDFELRFFTPTMEVPSCGHATIAAHVVDALERGRGAGVVRHRAPIGPGRATLERVGSIARVALRQRLLGQRRVDAPELRARAAAALGLAADRLDPQLPLHWIDTGHAKLLVPLRSARDLHAARPERSALLELHEQLPQRGLYVFAREGAPAGFFADARMFAPQIGIPEDPATGNGAGPLGAYAVLHGLVEAEQRPASLRIRQGHALGRAGVIEVRAQGRGPRLDSLEVVGEAVVCFRTTIDL